MSTANRMPTIDVNALNLSAEDREIVLACLNKGKLRASRPSEKILDGKAAYVWRMLVWSLSPNPVHHCMPVMADLYITPTVDPAEVQSLVGPGVDARLAKTKVQIRMRREITKHLDTVVKAVESQIPVRSQPGSMRWAHAFGLV